MQKRTGGKAERLEISQLATADLKPSKLNQRTGDLDVKELTESVKAKGVLVPLTVRPVVGRNHEHSFYEVAAGHRRLAAAKAAGLKQVPCIIREMDDAEFIDVMITDNLQRKDISPMDEAEGYARLASELKWDAAEIARRVGKGEDYVTRRMKLNDLSPKAVKAFREGKMLLGHAEALCRHAAGDQEAEMKESWFTSDAMPTVPVYERILRNRYMLRLGRAPFSKTDAKLLPKAGACAVCPKRTGCSASLFPDIENDDTCTDPACHAAKLEAHVVREVKAGRKPVSATPGHELARGGERHAGAVIPTRWKQTSAKGTCASSAPAVVSDGDGKGKLVTACFDERCKAHFGGGPAKRAASPAGQKAEKADEFTYDQRRDARHAIECVKAKGIVARSKDVTGLSRDTVIEAMTVIIEGRPSDAAPVLRAVGVIGPDETPWGKEGKIEAWGKKLDEADAMRMLWCVVEATQRLEVGEAEVEAALRAQKKAAAK